MRVGRGNNHIRTLTLVETAEDCAKECGIEEKCMSFEYDDQSSSSNSPNNTKQNCRLLKDTAPSYQEPIEVWSQEQRDFVFCQKADYAWTDMDSLIAAFKSPIKFEYATGQELFVRGSYKELKQTVWNRFSKIKMNPAFDSDFPMIELESSFLDAYPDGKWSIDKTGQICTEFGTSEHFANTYKGYARANLTTKDIDIMWEKILCKGGCAGTDCLTGQYMNFPLETIELKSSLKNDTSAIHYF
jgi:hypothetical protein